MPITMIGASDAPAPRNRVNRLTSEMRAMEVGHSFIADKPTARCYVSYARSKKFKVVTKKVPGGIQVWRLS